MNTRKCKHPQIQRILVKDMADGVQIIACLACGDHGRVKTLMSTNVRWMYLSESDRIEWLRWEDTSIIRWGQKA